MPRAARPVAPVELTPRWEGREGGGKRARRGEEESRSQPEVIQISVKAMETYPGFDEEVRGEELSRGSINEQAAVLVELDKHASPQAVIIKPTDEDLLLREQLVVVVAGAEEEVALLVGGHE